MSVQVILLRLGALSLFRTYFVPFYLFQFNMSEKETCSFAASKGR